MTEKVITTTIEQSHTVFVAFDGTEFDCNEECKKYEGSAAGVILSKLVAKATKVETSLDPFDSYYREGENYYIVEVDKAVLDLMNQIDTVVNNRTDCFNEPELGKLYMVGYRLEDGSVDGFFVTSYSDYIEKAFSSRYKLVKSTDNLSTYARVQAIKQQEREDLRATMRKYLGDDSKETISYKFKDSVPCIAAYVGDYPGDIEVLEVSLKDDCISLTIKDKESGAVMHDYDLDEIFAGHLETVTDSLVSECKDHENPAEQ